MSTCPVCKAPISWRQLSSSSCDCPSCAYPLRTSTLYRSIPHYAAMVFVSGCAYAIGLRGIAWITVAFFAVWPVSWILFRFTTRIFPPALTPAGDVTQLLYGNLPRSNDHGIEPADLASHNETPRVRIPGEPTFAAPRQPRTLEGVVIALGMIVLALCWVWMLLEESLARR